MFKSEILFCLTEIQSVVLNWEAPLDLMENARRTLTQNKVGKIMFNEKKQNFTWQNIDKGCRRN